MFATVLCIIVAQGVQQAIETLRDTRSPSEALSSAIEVVEKHGTLDDATLVESLVELWESDKVDSFVRSHAFRLACDKTGPRTYEIILGSARRQLAAEAVDAPNYGRLIFSPWSDTLIDRLPDPVPVLSLWAQFGSLQRLKSAQCPAPLRERYLIEALEQGVDPLDGTVTLACRLDRKYTEALYKVAIRKPTSPMVRRAAAVALRTLVDIGSPEAHSLLDEIGDEGVISESERQLYTVKLQSQDSREELIQILHAYSENELLLKWAAMRLLWLGEPRRSVVEALGSTESSAKRDIVAWIQARDSSEADQYISTSILNPAELAAFCDAFSSRHQSPAALDAYRTSRLLNRD